MTTEQILVEIVALAPIIHKIDRQLKIVEEKLDHLLHSTRPTTARFSKFTDLPTELRLRIWDLAIPMRKLRHHAGDSVTGTEAFRKLSTTGLRPPAISQVCRESRSVALRRGRMFQMHRWHTHQEKNIYYWTWFDGSHDILELENPECPISSDEGECLELLRHAEVILVQMQDLGPWVKELFRDWKVCQTLRTIYVQRAQSESVIIVDWDPKVVAKLFGMDSVAFVDVDDLAQVTDTLRLFLSNPTTHNGSEFAQYLEFARRAAERSNEGDRFTREWVLDMFKKAWFPKGFLLWRRHRPRTSGKKFPILKYEEAIAVMPRIRFVYTWELAENGRAVERGEGVDPLWGAFSTEDMTNLPPSDGEESESESEDDESEDEVQSA